MKKLFLLTLPVFIWLIYSPALAYRTETIPDTEVENDFVLGGGKTELELDPGEEVNGEISITNRMGKETEFKVEIEDFSGSRNPEDASFGFLGPEKGPYSLKDSIFPELTTFKLKHGERMVLPVKVSIPKDAEPGGRYGSVLVYVKNPDEMMSHEPQKAKSQVKIVSRLAALFYIRVKGQAKEEGLLKEFKSDKLFYESGPINFSAIFENNGNIHLKPSGKIEITNLAGRKIDEIEVGEFFVLPDSVRKKSVSWNRGYLMSYYTAKLTLNRGYSDLSDTKMIRFLVFPWKIILALFILSFALIWLVQHFLSKFEIRRK